jgi:hypothetical protein
MPEVPKITTAVGVAQIGAAVVQIGGIAATTIASIGDERSRTSFQQTLQLLTQDQQIALDKLLNNAKDANERLKILALTLNSSTSDRIGNIASLIAEQEKNRRTQVLANSIQVAALFVVAGVVIYFVTKNN